MVNPDIDFSDLSVLETQQKLGELVWMSIQRSRAAIFVARADNTMTILDPALLSEVPSEDLAVRLLDADWREEDITELFEFLDHRKEV